MINAISLLAPRRQLFVFSHMRSYSSLLCHILGSHDEIDGYCETHVKYRRRLDLIRLKYRVSRMTGAPLRGRYVLDKMLHDYPLAPSILASPNTRAVILLRKPLESLQSIVNMGERYVNIPWYRDPERVTRYYEMRTLRLADLAEKLAGRAAFLESETLLSDADTVLQQLTDFLELSRPLQRDYQRFQNTGKPGFGDPSDSILQGSIRAASAPRSAMRFPSSVTERLEQAYAAGISALRERCALLA